MKMPTPIAQQSQGNVILTKDKSNSLTANAAAVNSMSNSKSRYECMCQIFTIPVEKIPPSTSFRAKGKVKQTENMLETVLGLSNENTPSLFILTIFEIAKLQS